MTTKRDILIDPLSATSLRLVTSVRQVRLGSATGFIVGWNGRYYLITNWHVVAGRDPDTNQVLSPTGEVPDEVRISHHAKMRLGSWIEKTEPLYDNDGRPRWVQHPQGPRIDVVALPLRETGDELILYPLDLALASTDIRVTPGMVVFVIGYPLGLTTAGGWPIWKVGHIASDPDLDFQGKPTFIIDATARAGMSGAPVVLRSYGGYATRSGSFVMAGGPGTLFLGVFSAHIGAAEIGIVWRSNVIEEILGQAGT